MIVEVSYGLEVLPQNDPFIESAENGIATVNIAGQPGTFLVDMVPSWNTSLLGFPVQVLSIKQKNGVSMQMRYWNGLSKRLRKKTYVITMGYPGERRANLWVC